MKETIPEPLYLNATLLPSIRTARFLEVKFIPDGL